MVHFWITDVPILPIVVANPTHLHHGRATNTTNASMAFDFAEVTIKTLPNFAPIITNQESRSQ